MLTHTFVIILFITYMLGAILRKKITDEQFAKMFVSLVLDSTEHGFGDVAQIINEDNSFVKPPQIDLEDDGKFTLIVMAGNINLLEKYFDNGKLAYINELIYQEMAPVYDFTPEQMKMALNQYNSFMSRINHPSKNTLYAMSKAVFYKYELCAFQDEYFRNMQCPNPLFLKRMDEIMEKFMLNWDAYFKKFKMAA